MKTCPDCKIEKPLEEFGLNRTAADGHARYCKLCFGQRSRDSYRKRRAEVGRTVRPRRVPPPGFRWCPRCSTYKAHDDFPRSRGAKTGRGGYCKPCHHDQTRENAVKNYGSTREIHLRRRYGIGQVDVDKMLTAQCGRCAGCGKPDPEHVDHDHATGEVRGMLCFNCNQALGNVRDQIETLGKLQDYLLRASTPPPLGRVVEFHLRRAIVEVALQHRAAG